MERAILCIPTQALKIMAERNPKYLKIMLAGQLNAKPSSNHAMDPIKSWFNRLIIKNIFNYLPVKAKHPINLPGVLASLTRCFHRHNLYIIVPNDAADDNANNTETYVGLGISLIN